MSFLPSSQTTMDSTEPAVNYPPGLEKLFITFFAPFMDELRQLRHWQEQHSQQVAHLQSLVDECNILAHEPRPAEETKEKLESLEQKLDKLSSRLESLGVGTSNFSGGDETSLLMNEVKSLREYVTDCMGDIQSRLCALREDLPEPEEHSIQMNIRDPADKIDGMTVQERLDAVRELGNAFADVISVKYYNNGDLITPYANRREECFLLLHFGKFESELDARKDMSGVREAFELTEKSTVKPPIYVVEIENGYQRGAAIPGVSSQAKLESVVDGVFPYEIYGHLNAVSSYNRWYLETESLQIVMMLAETTVKLNNGYHKLIPSLRQARPKFCYRCGQPGHKKNECTHDERHCMKCSGDHDTQNCPLTDRKTFICSNCWDTGHGSFSPFCPHTASVQEHHRARMFRENGPCWARMNAAPRKRGRRSNAEKALKADLDLKRKRVDNEGKDEGVGQGLSEEQSASKRPKKQDGRNIEDMFNIQIKKSIEKAKTNGEPSSSQATVPSSSSQGQTSSQDTVGSAAKQDDSRKRKREDKGKSKGKGRSNDNTKPTDSEEMKATSQPVIPTQTQAVAKSQTTSVPPPQPTSAESNSTPPPPPPSGSSSRSKRNNRKRKEADRKQAKSGEAGEAGSTASSAGTGPQAVTLPSATLPSSVDHAKKKKERKEKRAEMKRKLDESRPPSVPVPGDASNV
ncbi:uncharacterized protein B0J16DRAFT_374953 [Fusarium flagelliforme]|uniref:CCHC-type domain-containing protein n=1 Tax=Fusarium flagelliforme TaxID=2675880 RepID=A0A395MVF6_9HYPO|nr:uncharacterized protein B0J16DRAFT_374953 [Fusarium flagelliforme]KAH7180003.1 hypothetical protein B0J16DRAFT_374953 [Fusarium flagelliforme]RFN51894.1 hypothetical protein FIE12Z_3855 [Fusarium flagelliforme]